MKKWLLRTIILFVIFFTFGFIQRWYYLTEDYQKCINKEYSTEIHDGMDFNEWWLDIHDNFSTEYKLEYSFYSGIASGILYSIVVLYLWLLYELFKSKDTKKIGIGIFLITVALIGLCLYYWFVSNFEIVF